MKVNTPILVLSPAGIWTHAYFMEDHSSAEVSIRMPGAPKNTIVSASKVMVHKYGYPRRYSKNANVKKGRVSTRRAYNKRKVVDNKRLLADFFAYGDVPMSEANLLVLDDFAQSQKQTNSMRSWIAAGGTASRVYVPNPDTGVCEAVQKAQGNAEPLELGEYVRRIKGLPRFDVVYADFCGFWSKHGPQLRELFARSKLARTTIIHVTTSKREGGNPQAETEADIRRWCDENLCVPPLVIRKWDTSTMWKSSFLIRSRPRSKRNTF